MNFHQTGIRNMVLLLGFGIMNEQGSMLFMLQKNSGFHVAFDSIFKGDIMEKIILKRNPVTKRAKRSSVVVSPNTYVRIYELANEVNMTVESLVDKLLTEALDAVEIDD